MSFVYFASQGFGCVDGNNRIDLLILLNFYGYDCCMITKR